MSERANGPWRMALPLMVMAAASELRPSDRRPPEGWDAWFDRREAEREKQRVEQEKRSKERLAAAEAKRARRRARNLVHQTAMKNAFWTQDEIDEAAQIPD